MVQRLLERVSIVVIMLPLVIGQSVLAQNSGDQKTTEAKFVAIVLGTSGGLIEGALSAIRQAHCMGSFGTLPQSKEGGLTPEGQVLQHHIKAYLLSHAHLDHVVGLILASAEDTFKSH